MPKYNYVAMDAKGKEVTGSVESESLNGAIANVREKGLFPTNVTEAAPAKDKKGARPAPGTPAPTVKAAARKGGWANMEIKLPGMGGVSAKVLTAFTRQLATLIDAGLAIVRGLDVLRKQEKNAVLKKTLAEMAEAIEGGSTFSEALAQHPKLFNKLYVNMVRAGEAGGVMDVTLMRLAEFQEKAQKIKNRVISAMVYPSVVMLVALGILTFLMLVIVPKFQEIFDDLLEGQAMPPLTRFVMGASQMVKDNILYVAAVVAMVVIAIKLIGKTEQGRFYIDKVKLNLPMFGQILRKAGIARFSRTLGTLIASGVPILQALNIVRDTAGNAVIANAVSRVHDSVKEGERVVQPLEASGVFPPMVLSMVDVGEETGALPDMLMKIADVYDDEVDNAVTALTSLLEPIMIVFLAVVVGTIVVAMFLPLIQIVSSIQA